MLRFAPRFQSPIHQALWSTGVAAVLGLAARFIGGAYVPELRTWTFVGLAPLLGVFSYLQGTRRVRLLSVIFIGLGFGGLAFWALILALRGLPVTGPADYFFIAFILAFPTACLALGWRQLRDTSVDSKCPPRSERQASELELPGNGMS